MTNPWEARLREQGRLLWGMGVIFLSSVNATASQLEDPSRRWWHFLAALSLLWLTWINQLRLEWTLNPQYNYGWGVPLLALYLFWQRWKDSPPAGGPVDGTTRVTVLAVALTASLLPIRLIQEANPEWRLVSWSYTLVVVFLTLILLWFTGGGGWVRHFLFPVLFLVVAVPWPSAFEQMLVQTLMRGVAAVTVECVNWCGVLAHRRGNLIELETGLIGVSEACSGVRSFQATLMAALFLGELHQLKWSKRLVLLVSGTALALLFNLGRTFLLTWVSAKNGTDAVALWHDPAGHFVFLFAFVGLVGVGTLLRRGQRPPTARTPTSLIIPKPLPMGVLIVFGLWLVGVEALTALWFRAHERDVFRRTAWTISWPEITPEFWFNPIAEDVRLLLRYNQGRSATWLKSDGSQWMIYFFKWQAGRAAAQLAKNHRPETCLPASGLTLKSDLGLRVASLGSVELPYRAYIFEMKGKPLYVFFSLWEEHAGSNLKELNEDNSRASRFRAVLAGRRHLGQQVLEVAVAGSYNQERAEREFRTFLQDRIRVLPP